MHLLLEIYIFFIFDFFRTLNRFPFCLILLVWIVVGQGPTALAMGVDGGCLDVFAPVFRFSSFSFSERRSNID